MLAESQLGGTDPEIDIRLVTLTVSQRGRKSIGILV